MTHRIQSHIVKRGQAHFDELYNVCRAARLVFDCANYRVRQDVLGDKFYTNLFRIISKYDLAKYMTATLKNHYVASILPARVRKEVSGDVSDAWKGLQQLAKKKLRPRPVRYLKSKNKELYQAKFELQALSKPLLKKGIVSSSAKHFKANVKLRNKKDFDSGKSVVKYMVYVPISKDAIRINVVYSTTLPDAPQLDSANHLGIDLGVSNFAACVSNAADPFIIKGAKLKYANNSYHRNKGKAQSNLPKDQFTSRRLRQLGLKRSNYIHNFMHNATKKIVNYCLTNNIGSVTVGYNSGWKKGINLGKRNNQKFVYIPYLKFITILEYKLLEIGVKLVKTEESYTSKCSWVDNESLQWHSVYKGKRVSRGLFRVRDGRHINADLNGAANIVRKADPGFTYGNVGINAVSNPRMWS